jgi:sugar/nucleoside kinase (ribokinase family)
MTDPRMNIHDTATPKRAPRILCIGMPVRDLTFRIDGIPERGSKAAASHFDQICGGNALNAAIGIARLGGHASLTGPMGDSRETSSKYIFELLAQEGIDTTALVHMPGLVTSISAIMIDPSGERTNVTFRDPQLWKVRLPDTDRLLQDCDAILTESRCAAFATDLCAEALKRGIPVVVDVDSVMTLHEGLLTASSHLIFSGEALRATAGIADDADALKQIAKLTPSFLAATRGPQGVIWLDRQQGLRQTPAFPVHTVDTLGAGDVFHGAFALALTEKQDVPGALRFASAAAALKCTRYGGPFACPQRPEVEALLSQAAAEVPADSESQT